MAFLSNLMTIAGALVPLLYLLGYAYWSDYVSALGLPADLFQIGFEETLIQGYFAATILGLPYLSAALLYLVLIFIAVHNANEFSKFSWGKKIISFFSIEKPDEEVGHSVTEKAVTYSKKVTLSSSLVAIVIGCTLVLVVQASREGKKSGADKLKALAKAQPENIIYMNNKQSILGGLLICQEAYCSIFSDKKSIVVSMSSIEKIVSNAKFD